MSTAASYLASTSPQFRSQSIAKPKERVASIDVLRGFIMIVMTLDHVRDFFTNRPISLTDPSSVPLTYFFTRWITHLCAPTFVFLAGVSAYLQLQRGKTKSELSGFLLKRGLWLMLLNLTLVYFVFIGPPGPVFLETIWSIGISMACLSLVVRLPMLAVACIGTVIVVGHNLLDGVHAASFGRWSWLWSVLHEQSVVVYHNHLVAFVGYPFLPWFGLMTLGFCFGRVIGLPAELRTRIFAWLGVALLVFFAGLRSMHGYGDMHPWTSHDGTAHTITTFLNVTKYPPSLQYMCVTLGISLLLLALFDSLLSSGRALWLRKTVEVYGRVPFLYYIAHLGLVHVVAIAVCAATGHDWHRFVAPLPNNALMMGGPAGYGFGLPVVYVLWVMFVVALFWPMKLYADYRKAHPEKWWLSYL